MTPDALLCNAIPRPGVAVDVKGGRGTMMAELILGKIDA